MAIASNTKDGGQLSPNDSELMALLKSLGLSTKVGPSLAAITDNPIINKALQQHFAYLGQKADRTSLSAGEQKNYDMLSFAISQESQRELASKGGASTYNGYLGRVYKDIEFVTDTSQIPKDTRINQFDQTSSYNVQKVTEAMTKVGAGTYAGAPPLPKELIGTYQVTDTKTGQTKYYYVLNKDNAIPPSTTVDGTILPTKPDILSPEEKKKEEVLGGGVTKNNTKPVKYPKLWYSPDYKKIYDAEIEQLNLLLLETADMMLSNFDYRTIDSLAENANPTISSQNDEFRVINYSEPTQNVAPHQTSPFDANKIYSIVSRSITPLRQALDESRNTDYQSILHSFGYSNKSNGFLRYRPYYSQNGTAYYDLSINIPDCNIVTGYKIYLIEEDGTI